MSSISTSLPPDSLILESTELSGKDAFEEIINPGTIAALDDPLKKLLMDSIDANAANAGNAANMKQRREDGEQKLAAEGTHENLPG